ncbi:hypothetical protein [Nocardioides jensenii]|nr:hypothetical protein [Nocardioides jensenii]
MRTTTKKMLAALIITAIATMGIAGPAEAKPTKGNGGAGVVQKLNDTWCC